MPQVGRVVLVVGTKLEEKEEYGKDRYEKDSSEWRDERRKDVALLKCAWEESIKVIFLGHLPAGMGPVYIAVDLENKNFHQYFTKRRAPQQKMPRQEHF